MINTIGDEYSSNTHFEASDQDNTFHDSKELEKMKNFIIFKNHISLFWLTPVIAHVTRGKTSFCV